MTGSEPPRRDDRGRRGGRPWSTRAGRAARCPSSGWRAPPAGWPPGTTVVLLADDVAAWSDVPAWARMRGHTVTLHEDDDWTEYRVLLGAPRTDRGQADSST